MNDVAQAHPGSIRAVIPHPFGGHVAMAGFPGLRSGRDGAIVFEPDTCRETVRGLVRLGARALVLLVESDELDCSGFELLALICAEAGVTIDAHPIVDFGVPDEQMVAWWLERADARAACLRGGGTLAFSCRHGAGRSGLMAAWSLMEGGMDAETAMATVRGHFPQAIETAEQETWLRAWSPQRDHRPNQRAS